MFWNRSETTSAAARSWTSRSCTFAARSPAAFTSMLRPTRSWRRPESGAIFLGELPNDPLVAETVFRDQDTAKTDKARFNQNVALGSRSRRLFLKADHADGGQALLAALEDDNISVVAAIFNAVDDQISS